jgi:hypothetical protein
MADMDPFEAMGGGVQLADGGWVPKDHPLAIAQAGNTTQQPQTAAPATSTQPQSDDPFAAMGGGVFINGGWVPKDHPSANPQQTTSTQPAANTAQPTSIDTGFNPATPDPFTAMGGGVYINGGWVPRDHPSAQLPGARYADGRLVNPPPSTQPPNGGGGGGTPQTGPNNPIANQAAASSTYTSNPAGPPQPNTTNAGTQDVVRNSYLAQATQGTKIDTQDPNFRQQADTFAAGVERQRRNFISDQAESLGPTATGALRGQERMAAEKAGQAIGGFEAELVGRELANRRQEIQTALAALGDQINSDLGRKLQRDLAELQAQMQRLGIETNAATSAAELDLRRYLGDADTGIRNRTLDQQRDQFADTLGFNMADREAYYNNQAVQALLP